MRKNVSSVLKVLAIIGAFIAAVTLALRVTGLNEYLHPTYISVGKNFWEC